MLIPDPMPFKENPPARSFPVLTGFSLLGFDGPDAATFLQSQTMNDVLALAVGQWQWNGWLNAKGRVIALFALLRIDADSFLAILPDYPASELQPLLQRYVFRSKLKITLREDRVCAANFDERLMAGFSAGDRMSGQPDIGLAMDWGSESESRYLLLLPKDSPALQEPQAQTDVRWLAFDLAHGLPRLPASQRETWTPQMLSLDRLRAFSLKKGCYPGQEIVARTHYLGQAKRGLQRVQAPALSVGESLYDPAGNAIGTVVSVDHEGTEGLAVCTLAADPDLRNQLGVAVSAPDLLPGLQRPL